MTTLIILSPLRGFLKSDDRIVLTEKFVDGLKLYRELWNGPLLHLCEPAEQESYNLDNIEIGTETPEFDTLCAPFTHNYLRSVIPTDSLVVTSVGEQFNSVSRLCSEIGVPCIYITELSLLTRTQLISEYQRGHLRGSWQKLRQVQQEFRQRRAISIASGVQCNGLPTYTAYASLNPNHHLFFDTRADDSMLATHSQIADRRKNRLDQKLKLAFSGRLTAIKGVDDLLTIAKHLYEILNGRFELSICGDGDYANQLKSDISRWQLGDFVTLRGNLDFKTELVPFLQNETDIFVCCHRQGDPSCTYLETMACGVPIVGYGNEAWRQLSDYAGVGIVVPMGSTRKMAQEIARLALSENELENQSAKSLNFASENTFGKTFRRRVEHFKQTTYRKQHNLRR